MKLAGLEIEVRKLQLKPEDIVVFRVAERLNLQQLDELRALCHDAIERATDRKHKILILSWGADISVLIDGALDREWSRIQDGFAEAKMMLAKEQR